MCWDSSGPLSAGLWLSQLTGSVSIVAYLMSWWMLPPADTGKVTEQYTSQPPQSLRPAASQPVCREHRHHQSGLSLSLSLIHAISHSHTSQPDLSSVYPMNLLLWFTRLCTYRPFSHLGHSFSLSSRPMGGLSHFHSLLPLTILSDLQCLALLSPTLTYRRP